MSDEHFRTFYWPSLKAVILALIDQGCVPFLFAEGGYNSRLQYIRDLPKGRCIWMFDRTDMAKAKEIVGKTTCISGNVPISKIMTGTPDKVRQICKELIDVAGKGGGYIMAMGCSADEGKADTMKAMIDFIMVNAWENMSAEEKQEARFSRWLAGGRPSVQEQRG